MAHHSRVGVLCIDCQTDDLAEAARFWGGLLGAEVEIDADGRYARIDGHKGYPKVLLQAVEHYSRIHLDIETDDQEGEVRRLTDLGASEVARVKDWIVMESPTGHRFCVVGPQGDDFPGEARAFG